MSSVLYARLLVLLLIYILQFLDLEIKKSISDLEMVLFSVGAHKQIYTELNNNRLTWTEQCIYKHPTQTNRANISISNMNGLVPLLSCQLTSRKVWLWILHTLTKDDSLISFSLFSSNSEIKMSSTCTQSLGTVKQPLALTWHTTGPT